MRWFIGVVGVLACMGLSASRLAAQGAPKLGEKAGADLIVGEPIRYANLSVFPISSRIAKNENRFITLDEGLRAGTVKIMEVGAESAAANAAPNQAAPAQRANQSVQPNQPANAPEKEAAPQQQATQQPAAQRQTITENQESADVNHLVLINHSTKPLYLMPGEIIIGGQQDRTIAQEYVIPPGDKPVLLEVFCVENGRWVGRGVTETAGLVASYNSNAAAASSNAFAGGANANGQALARQAQRGAFIGSVGNVSKGARVAVQGSKDQVQVWDKVGEANSKSGVKSESGDFASNYAEQQSVRRLEPYIKALNQRVAEQSQVVGVAIAIDGKMDTLDVFESTPLFRQLWPKLLKSYALDAANAEDEADAAGAQAEKIAGNNGDKKPGQKKEKPTEKVCTIVDARKFLAEAMTAPAEDSKTNGNVAVTTLSTDHILSFSAQDSRRNEQGNAGLGGGFGGGGFGGAIHASGFSK